MHYCYHFLQHEVVLKRLSTHYKPIQFTESALKAKTFEDEQSTRHWRYFITTQG